MSKLKKLIKRYPYFLILSVIIGVALFFRTYDLVGRYDLAHDADLYSWIVKDIVIEKHLRLIGQLTSAEGIFIGPLFYYLLIPFFLLTRMDPIGATGLPILISIITLISYYYVFSKLFNNKVAGLIAAFIHATTFSQIYFDKAVVPTTPTPLWSIWYLYMLKSIARKDYSKLWILGILIGLIWHIHIALIPTLVAIPVAFLVSRKLPTLKQFLLFLATLIITNLPLLIFELKHNFSQTQHLLFNLKDDHQAGSGLSKIDRIFILLNRNFNRLFLLQHSLPFTINKLLIIGVILSSIALAYKKIFRYSDLLPLFAWFFGVLIFFTLSSSPISEYYFTSIEMIYLTIISLWLSLIYTKVKFGKLFIILLFGFYLIYNFIFFVNESRYEKGYNEKKDIVEYIYSHSKEKGYPCISVSYMAPLGENVGFRYLFWLKNMHVNQPISGAPIYTIVVGEELAPDDIVYQSGRLGVIPPRKNEVKSKEEIAVSCSGQNSNLTDSLFGFTE